ncbi:MAG TPA: periplasmic heavy metal sensor [Thermoanaerobaculia bacterium]|nr:periplasmic heavy metal sensor [Thermoanaerobaculia bacterium]
MKPRSISMAIALMFVAAIATAQPRGPQHAVADFLQLSSEQITAWQQIQKDTAAAVQPLAANARDLQTQLDTALKAATPDAAAVGKLAISLHGIREQIRAAQDAAQAKRLAVLNADQKVKFQALESAREFMRQQRGGPGGGRGMRGMAMPHP